MTDLIAIGRGLVGEQVKKQFGVVWFSGRSLRSRAVWTCGKLFTKTTKRSRSTQLNCGTFCLRVPIFLPPASPNNFASPATVLLSAALIPLVLSRIESILIYLESVGILDTRHSELAADTSNSNFYFIKLQS